MTFSGAFEASREDRDYLRRMIVFSLLLHLLALSLSSLFSAISSPKKPLYLNYTVDLVSQADLGAKGNHGKSGPAGVAKESVKIPASTAKAGPGPADLPSSNKADAKKSAAKSMEKSVEKAGIRERSPAPPALKPGSKAEKRNGAETVRGDAIEKILKRSESSRPVSKPVSKGEKSKGSEAAKGDAIEELLKRADSSRASARAVRKGDSTAGSGESLGKAMDEIRRRVDSAERKQRAAVGSSGAGNRFESAAGSSVAGIPAGGGPSGTAGNAAFDARMYAYYRLLWSKIKKQWTMSPGLLPRQNIGAVIHVRVLRNGQVEEIDFEKRSGNNYFDESALRAVRKASPFPPLPEGVEDREIELGIRFHSAELR